MQVDLRPACRVAFVTFSVTRSMGSPPVAASAARSGAASARKSVNVDCAPARDSTAYALAVTGTGLRGTTTLACTVAATS